MGPESVGMCNSHVDPAQCIRALGCGDTWCVTILVDRQEDWQDQNSHGYEELQKHAKVAKEEVGVETTSLNEDGIGGGEEWHDPLI